MADKEKNFGDEGADENDVFDLSKESIAKMLKEDTIEQIKYGLDKLELYEDDRRIVAQIGMFAAPQEFRVGDLRKLVREMADPQNPLSGGVPFHLRIESDDPEKFFAETSERLNESRIRYLKKLEPYPDELLLTYIHPNHYTDYSGKVEYYQKTAGELRREFQDLDWETEEQLSHLGGIRIISADPNVGLDELGRRVKENEVAFDNLIRTSVDRVNLRGAISEELRNLPDDVFVSIPSEDGAIQQINTTDVRRALGEEEKQ